MIRGIFFLLVVFASSTVIAQHQQPDTLNRFDEKGRKDGYWEKRDVGDLLIYKGRFDHGRPVGKFIYYYPDTKIEAEIEHSYDGLIHYAKAVTYHHNGKIMSKGTYKEKKKHGKWEYFSPEGKLLSIENYQDGWKEGKTVIYHKNGRIAEEQYWKDGYEDSLWTTYNENGNIIMTRYYTRGKLNGEIKTYYDSGAIKMKGQYKNGEKTGTWIYYEENGKIEEKENY